MKNPIVETIRDNRKIISAFNSCDRAKFVALLDEFLTRSEDEIIKLFTKKRYVWNIIRGKDFYKMVSWYIVDTLKSDNLDVTKLNNIEQLTHITITSAANDHIRWVFVKSIITQVPLLTVDTIKYIKRDRLDSILETSNDMIICDCYVEPFMEYIRALEVSKQAMECIIE